jgi:radical SAM protein with 4Fe4S-binding SPASM domain
MALDGTPLTRAAASIQARTRGASHGEIVAQAADIYQLVAVMRGSASGCPTCALPDLTRAPLFGTPIHAPYKADLALTYGCNNACPHCYNEPGRYPMASLNKQQWFEVVNRLHEIGVPHLILTGGEATLHPDLPDIIRYADRLGHVVGLNTNGRRLAQQGYLTTLVDAGLNHVQITLGSSRRALHDAMMGAASFDQTVQGIRNAVASPLHAITNTTLMRSNMDHAVEIVDYLDALGIRTFAMNGMIYSGGGFSTPAGIPADELPSVLVAVRDRAVQLGMRFLWYTPTEYCRMSPLELELGAKRCNAGEYSLCIEPNGDVLPCQSYYVTAGNILHDPWQAIWHSDLFHSFRGRVDDPLGAGLPQPCWDCPDLPLCGGGCRIEREAREGVRSAADAHAAGCTGCTSRGSHTTSQASQPIPLTLTPDGFTPNASLTNSKRRGSGAVAALDLE